jgi:hypothetical protein
VAPGRHNTAKKWRRSTLRRFPTLESFKEKTGNCAGPA